MKSNLTLNDFFGGFSPGVFYDMNISELIQEGSRTTLTKNAAISYMMKNLNTQRSAIWDIVKKESVKHAALKMKDKILLAHNEEGIAKHYLQVIKLITLNEQIKKEKKSILAVHFKTYLCNYPFTRDGNMNLVTKINNF
jgi:hypothetical protein